MRRFMQAPNGARHRSAPLGIGAIAAALALPAAAFQFETGDPDLKILWDTTFKYSTTFRVEGSSQAIVGSTLPNYDPASPHYFPNTDDGSRNFKTGPVSNRLDILSELDILYRNVGARVSGAGWYDTIYRRNGNANNSPTTANPISVDANQFTHATQVLMGADAELLDAFVFAKGTLGDGMRATIRLGKHTLLYGESLMLGANGIAAAQAPIDVIKAATVPNAQFKEFMMPVNQVSGQLQITPDVMIGGYYMFEWKSDRLPASGSYFSFMDALGTGAERLIVGYSPLGNVSFNHVENMHAKNSGQFGLQLRFHIAETDYGLYAVQWNDHGPAGPYLMPFAAPVPFSKGLQVGNYQFVFHEGIRAVGASANTTFDKVNFGAEVSYRWNTPVSSDAQVNLSGGNNSDNPLYATGKSVHAQINWIASLGPTFLANEADFVGELAWNRLLSVSRNPNAVNPLATRNATNIRFVFEPKYRQVFPGVDLSVPVGVGYGIDGNSSVVGAFQGEGIGDISVGLNGSYLDAWRFGLSYTHYFGSSAPFIAFGHQMFKQYWGDRDYVSLNIRRTF